MLEGKQCSRCTELRSPLLRSMAATPSTPVSDSSSVLTRIKSFCASAFSGSICAGAKVDRIIRKPSDFMGAVLYQYHVERTHVAACRNNPEQRIRDPFRVGTTASAGVRRHALVSTSARAGTIRLNFSLLCGRRSSAATVDISPHRGLRAYANCWNRSVPRELRKASLRRKPRRSFSRSSTLCLRGSGRTTSDDAEAWAPRSGQPRRSSTSLVYISRKYIRRAEIEVIQRQQEEMLGALHARCESMGRRSGACR